MESDLFQESYKAALDQWQRALDEERAKEQEYSDPETINVLILVWGPGSANRLYTKRRTIAEHLIQAHRCNHAVFSEDIILYNAKSQQIEVIEEEIRHAFRAHLIIILEADPTWKALGPYSEKVLVATRPEFAKKVVDLIPERYKPGNKGGGLPQIVTERVDPKNIMYYSQQQLTQCHEIRGFCERKAAEARLRLFYSYREARQGITKY